MDLGMVLFALGFFFLKKNPTHVPVLFLLEKT